ncbi:MAG: cyclic-phosphate processing receiver domain-containing protein [Pyrinomonadaceae bacterium]
MNVLRTILIKLGLADLSAERAPITVFLLDDDTRRHRWFKKRFKGDHLEIAETVEEAKRLLSIGTYDAIFLDHDLRPHHYETNSHDDFENTGQAIADWLGNDRSIQPAATIIVHTRNAVASEKMIEALNKSGRKAEYVAFPMLDLKISTYWNK